MHYDITLYNISKESSIVENELIVYIWAGLCVGTKQLWTSR